MQALPANYSQGSNSPRQPARMLYGDTNDHLIVRLGTGMSGVKLFLT